MNKDKIKERLVKQIARVLKRLHKDDALFDDGYGYPESKHPFSSDAHADIISELAPFLSGVLMGGDQYREYPVSIQKAAASLYYNMWKQYVKEHNLKRPAEDDMDEGLDGALDLNKRLR